MQIGSFVIGVSTLLTATMPTDDMIQAQLKAGAVGGALLGTLIGIGIGIGLMWLLLTRRKSSHKEERKVSQPKLKEEPVILKLIDSEKPNTILEEVVVDQIILGRNPERCAIVLAGDDTVSGVHCKFYCMKGKLFLIDLASTNGTFVNNVRIDKNIVVQYGDVVQIGMKKYKISY